MKVAVVGCGLVGASIGLALRERLGAHVAGVDLDARPALDVGALDEAGPLAEMLAEAEAAFVAVPVPALPEVTNGAGPAVPMVASWHDLLRLFAPDRR